MPKVNVYHPCITRISYHQEKGDHDYGTCLWADFEFDTINYRLQIMSDCGNYSYQWVPTPGKESFFGLCRRIKPDYLISKISCETAIDRDATLKSAIDLIFLSIECEADFEDDWETLLECELAAISNDAEIANHIVSFADERGIEVDPGEALYCIQKTYPAAAKRIVQIFDAYIKPKIPKE